MRLKKFFKFSMIFTYPKSNASAATVVNSIANFLYLCNFICNAQLYILENCLRDKDLFVPLFTIIIKKRVSTPLSTPFASIIFVQYT